MADICALRLVQFSHCLRHLGSEITISNNRKYFPGIKILSLIKHDQSREYTYKDRKQKAVSSSDIKQNHEGNIQITFRSKKSMT